MGVLETLQEILGEDLGALKSSWGDRGGPGGRLWGGGGNWES